jgi:hypothetical protein
MTAQLREALAELGESTPHARLTPDVWQRGRRARRRAQFVQSAAALTVALLVVLLSWSAAGPRSFNAADSGDAVPAKVVLPWMWQATVQMDPPGPASLLFGGDSIGLRGTDLIDSEGKLAVVGRGGDYRMLLYSGWDSVAAGEDALLSPDGTRVAHPYVLDSGLDGEGLVVTDLTTGRSRQYRGGQASGCCLPMAWAPDGRTLLATISGDLTTDPQTGILSPVQRPVLLDLTTGTLSPLGEYQPGHRVRTASRAAFAGDGQRFALAEGNTLRLLDRAGAEQWRAELGDRRYLAGVGAFSPDGTLIATVSLDGCLQECDERALAARQWAVGYLDAATGRPVAGPAFAAVTGMAVRALGWTRFGELVVLRYLPEQDATKTSGQEWNDTGWYETGHVTLLALAPDGSTRTLLDPPDGVLTMDVARDLLTAGRFGGPSPTASILPARGIILVALVPAGILTAVIAGATFAIVWRRRRRARDNGRPSRQRHNVT